MILAYGKQLHTIANISYQHSTSYGSSLFSPFARGLLCWIHSVPGTRASALFLPPVSSARSICPVAQLQIKTTKNKT